MKVTHDDPNTTTDYMFFNEGHGLRSLGEAGWQIVEVRRAVNADPAASAAYKQYAWDLRYIDAPVCRWWDGDGDGQMEPASGEMQYFTNDGNFNTTALIDANSGQVVERYQYDPYGKVTVLNGATGAEKDPNVTEWSPDADNKSDWDNDILFCGYRYDPETGLCEVRRRYYNWLTGRWQTRDPSRYVDGPSLYEYCRSGPIRRRDPQGLADDDNPLAPPDGTPPTPGGELGWKRTPSGEVAIEVVTDGTKEPKLITESSDPERFSEYSKILEADGHSRKAFENALTPEQWLAKHYPFSRGDSVVNPSDYFGKTEAYETITWMYQKPGTKGVFYENGAQSYETVSNEYLTYHADYLDPYVTKLNQAGSMTRACFSSTNKFKQCCSTDKKDWGVLTFTTGKSGWEPFSVPGKTNSAVEITRRSLAPEVEIDMYIIRPSDPKHGEWFGNIICLTCEKSGSNINKKVMGCVFVGFKANEKYKWNPQGLSPPINSPLEKYKPYNRYFPMPPTYGLLPDDLLPPGYKNISLGSPGKK